MSKKHIIFDIGEEGEITFWFSSEAEEMLQDEIDERTPGPVPIKGTENLFHPEFCG